MERRDVLDWVRFATQIIVILGAMFTYIATKEDLKETEEDLKETIDARIKIVETRIESVEDSIREVKEDINRLNQMHMPSGASFERRTQPPSR